MSQDTALLRARETPLANGWLMPSDLQVIKTQVGTPTFVYSEAQLCRNVGRITDAARASGILERIDLYVPFFPNSNPHVVRAFQQLQIGILLQLPSELEILRGLDFDKFIVSTGHVSDRDIDFWAATGYPTFLSSIDELTYLLENHPGASVNVRFDSLNCGKPGIKYSELEAVAALLARHGRQLDCFELYCGSGHTLEEMISVVEQVFMIFTTYFPAARAINFAGGFAFDYSTTDQTRKHFDWTKYFASLRAIAARYRVPDHVRFLFEPARDILGDVAALLLRVERPIITHPGARRLLTDGSRVLMPSAQYKERRHNVVFLDSNINELTGDTVPAALRGKGILRHDYVLPGDYPVPTNIDTDACVLILDVGAYCATQHMEFLNIPPAAEVLIDRAGAIRLITSRGGRLDKWRHLLPDPVELRIGKEALVEATAGIPALS